MSGGDIIISFLAVDDGNVTFFQLGRGNVVYGLKNGYEIINQGLSPSIKLKWKRLFAFRIIHKNKTPAITVPGFQGLVSQKSRNFSGVFRVT